MTHEPISYDYVKILNQAKIFSIIRSYGPTTQAQIARVTGLSQPTVTRVIARLQSYGLVITVGKTSSSLKVGRRGDQIAVDTKNFGVVTVIVGTGTTLLTLNNLDGEILEERVFPMIDQQSEPCDYSTVLEQIVKFIAELIGKAKELSIPILGIGISVPGMVNDSKGLVINAPTLNWINCPLGADLEKAFPYPICVENDVNLAALGEFGYGAGKGSANFILVYLGEGLGAGVIINNELYRGSHQGAAEVGYMVPNVNEVQRNYQTGPGAYENLLTGRALRNMAQNQFGKNCSAQEIFIAADQREPWAVSIIQEFIKNLAMLLINVSVMIDPDVIILTGGLTKSAHIFYNQVNQLVKDTKVVTTDIVVSQIGIKASLLGSTLNILSHVVKTIV